MRKLSLDVAGLAVESFPTSRADEALKGTVDAAEFTVKTAQCGSCGGERGRELLHLVHPRRPGVHLPGERRGVLSRWRTGRRTLPGPRSNTPPGGRG